MMAVFLLVFLFSWHVLIGSNLSAIIVKVLPLEFRKVCSHRGQPPEPLALAYLAGVDRGEGEALCRKTLGCSVWGKGPVLLSHHISKG